MNIEPRQPTFTIGTGLMSIIYDAVVKAEVKTEEAQFIENQLNKIETLNKEICVFEKEIAQSKKVIVEAKDKSIPTPVPGQHIDLTVDDINVKPVSPEAVKLTAIAKAMKDAQK